MKVMRTSPAITYDARKFLQTKGWIEEDTDMWANPAYDVNFGYNWAEALAIEVFHSYQAAFMLLDQDGTEK